MHDHAYQSDGESKTVRAAHAVDDLISVTVRKESSDQEIGLSLVERDGQVTVTKIAEDGLFYGSELGVGDEVLSINGVRLRNTDAEIGNRFKKRSRERRHAAFLSQLNDLGEGVVTLVVKKGNVKARRGVRSLSPRTRRRQKREAEIKANKTFRGIVKRNADGSFNCRVGHESWKVDDENVTEEIIKAIKDHPKQDVGIRLRLIDNKVFVSKISNDSIFLDADPELEIGDRIVEINGMSFQDYGNDKYAMKIIGKAEGMITLLVERGHDRYLDAVLADDEVDDSNYDINNNSSTLLGGASKPVLRRRLKGSSSSFQISASELNRSSGSIQMSESEIRKKGQSGDADEDGEDDSDSESKASSVSISSEDEEEIYAKLMKKKKKKKPQRRGRSRDARPNRTTSPGGGKPVRLQKKNSNSASKIAMNSSTKILKEAEVETVKQPPPPPTPLPSDSIKTPEPAKKESVMKTPTRTKSSPKTPTSKSGNSAAGKKIKRATSSASSTRYTLTDFGNDFVRVTVKKENDDDITIRRGVGGKFYVSKLPPTETRIGVGAEVLGVNGVQLGSLFTVEMVSALIRKSEDSVVLIINFDMPIHGK